MHHKFYWLNPKLTVKKTDKYEQNGSGVFSKSDIKKGERLLVVGGYVMTLEEEAKLLPPLNDYGVQVDDNLVLCISDINYPNGINFFNHSCEPNTGFNGQIFLVAIRDIKKNDEVVFDYAMVLYHSKNAKPYKMKCLCGSINCRGIITDNDWKIKKLQKRYKGYFQYCLSAKMKP